MWRALQGVVLLTLVAPLFTVPALAQESIEETGMVLPVEETGDDFLPEENSGTSTSEEVLAEGTKIEQVLPEGIVETGDAETETTPQNAIALAETLPTLFMGIGQTTQDAISDHIQSGEWYLGQSDIMFTSPGFLHYIVVFPDIEDPDFVDCKDSVYGTNTLNIWFGRGSSSFEAMNTHFISNHRTPREDGGCVYENRDGVFVYPGTSFTFLLNSGYGSAVAFDYRGSSHPISGLGTAKISNSNVSAPQLIWKKESSTTASLSYLMSFDEVPPPSFSVPQDSGYVWASPGVTLEELSNYEVLAQGTSEEPDGLNYTLSFSALNDSAYFQKPGNLMYAKARLGYYHDSPNSRIYFSVEGRDCRTPEKMLFEWGIYSGGKGEHVNEVIIGPFSGTECFFEALNPEHPRETAFAIRTMFNNNRSDMSVAGKGNVIDISLYSSMIIDPCLRTVCVSNVLFLPGIKGSRLYIEDGNNERRLWEPNGDDDVPELFLSEAGKSIRDDVYVKPGGVVDDVAFNLMNIYDLFIEDMDELQSTGVIHDWEAVPYDWRLSLPDIVSNGAERDGKIFFNEASSTPYIEQTLRALAQTSKTGKVTIVAHSNGGLVTKALSQKIGIEATRALIDKIIFVGVPQSGAPQALGALLYGEREKLPDASWLPSFILNQETARSFAENSPMGYHLLPSQTYFDAVREDFDHPVARFISGYEEEVTAYDGVIGTFEELARYLRAEDGGRTKPSSSDLVTANVLSPSLVHYAQDIHETLDSWTPPEDVRLYQIAGWGRDTIAGVEFYEECGQSGCKEKYRPLFTEDGDGVVPVPSALAYANNIRTKNFWVDLVGSGKDHGSLFGFDPLLLFVKKVLYGENSLSEKVQETSPKSTTEKRLRFILHSPLSLELINASGDKTNETQNNIKDSMYGEFGDVKFITAPESEEYTLTLRGYASGTFSIDIQEMLGSEVSSVATLTEVPVTEKTVATLEKEGAGSFLLSVDLDGNSVTDFEVHSKEDQVVSYIENEPVSQRSKRSSGAKIIPTPKTHISEKDPEQEVAEEVLGTSTIDILETDEVKTGIISPTEIETPGTSLSWLDVLYNFIMQIFSAIRSVL